MPYFVAISVERAGRDLVELRRELPDEAYIVAVSASDLSNAWSVRLIELGADDVVVPRQRIGLQLALARAKRALSLRAQTREANNTLLNRAIFEHDSIELAVDYLPAPIFAVSDDGRYITCNRAYADFVGLPKERLIGATALECAPPQLAQFYEDADRALLASKGHQLYETSVVHADGSVRTMNVHKAAFQHPQTKRWGIGGVMVDISERKRLEAKLHEAANRDPLTGAYNRRKFFEVAAAYERNVIAANSRLAVLVIDVDKFKLVNDHLGHPFGDRVLCRLLEMIANLSGDNLTFARAWEEEFFGILSHASQSLAMETAEQLRRMLEAEEFFYHEVVVHVTASIGVAMVQAGYETLWQALARADRAVYRAKQFGRNCVVFDEGLDALI